MHKKLLTGVLAAGAMAVPLAGVAWADPAPNPNPPAVPESNYQGPANPASPVAPVSTGEGPICVVAANPPASGSSVQGATAQGTTGEVAPGTTWRQVATLQGSVATDLGVPAGQPMNVYCVPAGSPNAQGQPASAETPGQTNSGQVSPVQPGSTGSQNPTTGQR